MYRLCTWLLCGVFDVYLVYGDGICMCCISLGFSFWIFGGLSSLGNDYIVGGVGKFLVLGGGYSLDGCCILFGEYVLGICGYMGG